MPSPATVLEARAGNDGTYICPEKLQGLPKMLRTFIYFFLISFTVCGFERNEASSP